MTTVPSRPTTVWQLAATTCVPLETVIFQAVAYGAWQPGGVIAAEWSDSLSSILHSSTPWRRLVAGPGRQAEKAGSSGSEEADPVAAFAVQVVAALGRAVPVDDPDVARAAERAGLGRIEEDSFVGFPEEAASWSQLASGQLTFDELAAGRT